MSLTGPDNRPTADATRSPAPGILTYDKPRPGLVSSRVAVRHPNGDNSVESALNATRPTLNTRGGDVKHAQRARWSLTRR